MQEIVSSSSARRPGAFEKSVIVKWSRRRRRRRWHPIQPRPPVLVALLVALAAFSKTLALTASQLGHDSFEDSPTRASPSEYSHTIFSLGDNADADSEAAQDNEPGKTLSPSPINSIVGAAPSNQRTGSSRNEHSSDQQPPAPGNSKSDQRQHLHVVDFGDHAEPSELATTLTLGGGGGGGRASGNQTVVAENNLLKSNAGGKLLAAESNRTSSALIADSAHFLRANNQTSDQQVGAGQSGGPPAETSAQSEGGAQQQHSLNKPTGSGNGQWRRLAKESRRRKKKRRKFSSQQASRQRNATAETGIQPAAGASSSPHQMITYVPRGQQAPAAHQFERLLSPSQPLARFLQPSAFKLALNSPLLFGQLQLDERQQQHPFEFGRYHLHTNSGAEAAQASHSPRLSLALGGPFELEQLQATASTRQNKKVQHSMFSHEQERSPGQLLQTHESSKLEQVNEELATPTTGQSPPAISDHLDEEDGGEMGEPGSRPALDYEPDEAGGELFSSSVQDTGGGGDGDADARTRGNTTTLPAGVHPTSGRQVAAEGTPGVGNKTAAQASASELAEEEQEEGEDPRQVAAQSKSSPTVQAAHQQRPGLKIANNELLVGPFRSEAEAPATITLAGVVYQKSGSSSALLRAAPAATGDKQPTAANNLDLSLTLGAPGQLRSERAGPTPLADWPHSMLNENVKSPAPQAMSASGSVYLGTLGQPPPPAVAMGPTLVGQTGGGDQNAGEQMSLSSSSAKPMTSVRSIAGQLVGGAANELVIATGGSAASLLGGGTIRPDLVAPQLSYASPPSAQQQVGPRAAAQLYQQRLPDGSTIWTLNKPALPGGASLASLMQAAASSDSSASQSSGVGGGSPFEVGVASSEPSESKHKAQGGPIVIVQKDVKPVKYHLLRAYLKLRRLLRPYEATYVFPGDHAHAASSSAAVLGAGGGVVGSNAFLRRRQPDSLSNLQVSRRARRWPRARRFLGGGSGRLER